MDRTNEGQFKNQPRLGAAIRQRSHSTKELATMLQQLQMSVQLMPLSQPANQPNLASTSEEDSDSLNSNEVSTSEDEAFGDYEEDEDDYAFRSLKAFGKLEAGKSRAKPAQLNLSSSFSTGLVYPKKLRRSNSLGVLNSKQPYKDSYRDLYCEDDYEDADFRESFRAFSNEFRRSSLTGRNSSFRSTLPRVRLRYSASLKDNLNSLANSDNYNSGYADKFAGDEFAGKFDDKYRNTYAEKYGDGAYGCDYKADRLFRLIDYPKDERPSSSGKPDNLKRSKSVGLGELASKNSAKSKQNSQKAAKADSRTGKAQQAAVSVRSTLTGSSPASAFPTSTSTVAVGNAIGDNRNLVNGNQSSTSTGRPSACAGEDAGRQAAEWITCREGDCLNQESSAGSPASNSVCLSSFNQLNHPKQSDHSRESIAAAAGSDDNCAATSGLVGSAVSGGAYEITAHCGSTAADINNKVNFKSSVSSCICEPSVEYSSSDDLKNLEKSRKHSSPNEAQPSNRQPTNETNGSSSAAQRPSSDKCVIQTTTIGLRKVAERNDHRLNELELATAGAQQHPDEPQQTGLDCDENAFDRESGDVLTARGGSSARQPVIKSILKRSASRQRQSASSRAPVAFRSPDLPVLIEEQRSARSTGGPLCRRPAPHPPLEMQTLAETQYNQLGYHIAALSCVCDNKQNLTSNFSPFNSSSTNNPNYNNQNSPSSVDSDEYSSPYNSPPSSPSSVSSYSSAEEDCSILTSRVQNGLQLNRSSAGSLNKALSGSNQSLADLITLDHSKLVSEVEPSLDVVDCAAVFASSRGSPTHRGLLTTATSLAKFNSDLNNNKDGRSKAISLSNGSIGSAPIRLDQSGEQQSESDDQLISEKQSFCNDHNDNSDQQNVADHATSDPPAQLNKPQVRVRKTSILRNQTPPDLANYCKKEVKFADTLGFELEKVKYFPPASPQVKPKRHSVNLASLHRDYDEQHELFILHSRPQTEDIQTLAKRFEERSALFSKQQTRLNLETNIFNSKPGGQSHASGSYYSPPSQWGGHLFRDEYCGDMFHPFEANHHPSANAQPNHESNDKENGTGPAPTASSTIKAANLMSSSFSSMNYKSSSLEFNGFNQTGGFTFMNNQTSGSGFSSMPSLSSFQNSAIFLPLNFCAQPHIQSDFPNRLHSQSVLLHSLEFVGNTINGIISVMNLTFEKKIVVKHTLNKWVTEKHCEARYSKKDCDNSDKFIFQISLKETDFPQFQLDEDRTMMFAVRYETGDGRIYWDNNFGQDYRLKCKFN